MHAAPNCLSFTNGFVVGSPVGQSVCGTDANDTEDPRLLLAHFMRAAATAFEPVSPGFATQFMSSHAVDQRYEEVYTDVHHRFVRSAPGMAQMLG